MYKENMIKDILDRYKAVEVDSCSYCTNENDVYFSKWLDEYVCVDCLIKFDKEDA